MPKNIYVSKVVPGSAYRVDNRVTLNVPLKPVHANIVDGPTVAMQSGYRLHYPSGTDN